MSDRLFILKGALDVLILKALSWGPMHGYGVSYWIRDVTGEAFELQEGVQQNVRAVFDVFGFRVLLR